MGGEDSRLREFLLNCSQKGSQPGDYLHLKTANVLQVKNLTENLALTLFDNTEQSGRGTPQLTLGLLFLHLLNHMDRMQLDSAQCELALKIMQYVEERYADGSLNDMAKALYYDVNWLSANIKRLTGRTFTQLLQNKRISQAKFLLDTTDLPVIEIMKCVGYNNSSYFYRLFGKQAGCSPADYRSMKNR